MPEYTWPVLWTGRYAVVSLPRDIDGSNASHIREQLLWVINRGAAVLVADMSATASCDHRGADALARAHVRAVENGTELRLVAGAYGVRHVLSSSGLDRIMPVYAKLEAAVPPGAERLEVRTEQSSGIVDWTAPAEELLDSVVSSIFSVGLTLNAVTDPADHRAVQRITEALQRLEDVVRDVRDRVFAGHGPGVQPDVAVTPLSPELQRSALAMKRAALLQQRVAQAAHALQFTATDTAALLERQADLAGLPARIDYPAEIKRFRVLADQAGQIAERWDHQP